MKLLTVSGAIRLAGLIAVLAGFRLSAQDVMISDPAWHNPKEPPAEALPIFQDTVLLSYPGSLAESDQSGYVLVRVTVNTKGERQGMSRHATHPAFEHATKPLGRMKYMPAQEKRSPVPVKAWYAVIFNSKAAAAEGDTVAPRLLAVAPVTAERIKLGDAPLPLLAPAVVSLNEAGAVTKVVFEQEEMEYFRKEVEASLREWRFAPARKDGVAQAGQIALPFMIWGPEKAEPKSKTPAQIVKRERPKFPASMRREDSVDGEVVVAFVVNKQGKVTEVSVVRSSHREFEKPALECVAKWTFRPAMEDGEPVNARMQVPIVFSLRTRSSGM